MSFTVATQKSLLVRNLYLKRGSLGLQNREKDAH